MIGLKKTPIKLVLSIFFLSLLSILLIYVDTTSNNPLPIEEITISKNLNDELSLINTKQIHQVKKGDNLSVIFEDKKVPLNLAYKIFDFDRNNSVSYTHLTLPTKRIV